VTIERSRFNYLTKFNPHFVTTLIKSLTKKLRSTIINLKEIAPVNKTNPSGKTTLSGFFQNKRRQGK